MESIIKTIDDKISIEQFGGKAYGLKWLAENHFPIPVTYFAKTVSFNDCTEDYYRQLSEEIKKIFSNNEKIAIRSSGINEDGETESKAGNYKTFLNVNSNDCIEICRNHKEIIFDAKKRNDYSGVIFQEMISSEYSGVIFTSNPSNFSKKEMIISYRKGIGESLVSGKTADSVDLTIIKNRTLQENLENREVIESLVCFGKKIEELQNMPMDIEWAVERGTGKIYILQCRPITTILLPKNEIKKVTLDSIGDDSRLKSLDKITLRLEAEKNDIMISNAYIVNCNCDKDEFPLESIVLKKSEFCKGYNIVVISPKNIDGKIVRHFIGKKENALKCITCNRYTFRSFPSFDNIYSALCSIYNQVKEFSWICTMIIQEIFDPKYTGIVKQRDGTTFIEIARGHFVAKGIVPMSTYVIADGQITKNEVEQSKYYRILEGHQIEQYINNEIVHVDDDSLLNIQNQFEPILKRNNYNLEFGLLELDMELYPYLIDFTLDSNTDSLTKSDVEQKIMSNGKLQGKLIKLPPSSIDESLNTHCQNQIYQYENEDEAVIYGCDLPDIKLMEKLGRKNIGFIFKTGSLLCHLAILLRERHIPALLFDDIESLEEGAIYKIDTYSSHKLTKEVHSDE